MLYNIYNVSCMLNTLNIYYSRKSRLLKKNKKKTRKNLIFHQYLTKNFEKKIKSRNWKSKKLNMINKKKNCDTKNKMKNRKKKKIFFLFRNFVLYRNERLWWIFIDFRRFFLFFLSIFFSNLYLFLFFGHATQFTLWNKIVRTRKCYIYIVWTIKYIRNTVYIEDLYRKVIILFCKFLLICNQMRTSVKRK